MSKSNTKIRDTATISLDKFATLIAESREQTRKIVLAKRLLKDSINVDDWVCALDSNKISKIITKLDKEELECRRRGLNMTSCATLLKSLSEGSITEDEAEQAIKALPWGEAKYGSSLVSLLHYVQTVFDLCTDD